MTAVTIQATHPELQQPRGAVWAAEVATAAWNLLDGLLRRVRHQRTRTEEAAAVREMALQYQFSDPGFASDLFAAAARHESLDD